MEEAAGRGRSSAARQACTVALVNPACPPVFAAPPFEGVERLFVGALGMRGRHAIEHQPLNGPMPR